MARLRRAGRARGRRRARGARRRSACRRRWPRSTRASRSRASASRCASASTPARCSRARWATATRSIGDTVNVAARLQSAAQPGSVTVGERTMRATRDAVEYRAARAARAEGQGRARARLGGGRADRRAARRRPRAGGEAPLVGRADELELLDSLYGRVVREGAPAPGHRHRPGGRRQVAAAARARARLCEQDPRPTFRVGPLPAVRLGRRLLGARRDRPRPRQRSSTTTAPTRPGRSSAATSRTCATRPTSRARPSRSAAR